MAKNRRNAAGGSDLSMGRGEDGSFEILSGDEQVSQSTQRPAAPKSGGSLRWIAVLAVCAVLVVGGVTLAATLGADDDEEEQSSETTSQPAFRPYAGGGATGQQEEGEIGAPARQERAQRRNRENDRDRSQQEERIGERSERSLGERPFRPVPEEKRGSVEVRDGEQMGRWEAEERVRRELEGLEKVDHDFQRRLRRRDIERHSRVLQASDEDGRLVPAIEVSEDLQRRLQEQFSREQGEHLQDDASVGADDYRRDDFYHDDDAYYEENFDDYYGDYDDY